MYILYKIYIEYRIIYLYICSKLNIFFWNCQLHTHALIQTNFWSWNLMITKMRDCGGMGGGPSYRRKGVKQRKLKGIVKIWLDATDPVMKRGGVKFRKQVLQEYLDPEDSIRKLLTNRRVPNRLLRKRDINQNKKRRNLLWIVLIRLKRKKNTPLLPKEIRQRLATTTE